MAGTASALLFAGNAGDDSLRGGIPAYVVDTSCEQIVRKAPKSGEDKGENDTQSPSEDRKKD
jgi:hypothetical protein